jgi:putative hydrolase of the HAD superfamily
VRAVFFDAVGTVIHPNPSAADAYVQIGQRFGSRLDPGEVRRRFTAAFKRQEVYDLEHGLRSDEQREQKRWRMIVTEVLNDVDDPEGCFAALYEHFALPDSWRSEPEVRSVFLALREAGYQVGLASNFDHRLRSVVEGMSDLVGWQHLVISSEVGWKKPAARFFNRTCELVRLASDQVMLVGDDEENDYLGARAAGLHALLFDPRQRSALGAEQRIGTLGELVGGGAPPAP